MCHYHFRIIILLFQAYIEQKHLNRKTLENQQNGHQKIQNGVQNGGGNQLLNGHKLNNGQHTNGRLKRD